jgi:hypothetical protein
MNRKIVGHSPTLPVAIIEQLKKIWRSPNQFKGFFEP